MTRILDLIFRVFVGCLFIFSGLIKVNDPIGTAIKLEEYFEVFSSSFASFFHIFIPIALPLAVILVVLEVVLGVAVLINFQMKQTTLVLLLIILFFTALTFFSAFTGKVTDCGCFGDAIPLTPWQSFYKDLILLVMILWLFFRRNTYQPLLGIRAGVITIGVTFFVSVFLSVYAIEHLPFLDFRPYKIGDSIPKNMEFTEPPKFSYIMEKDGEEIEMEEYPTDQSYTFVSMKRLNPESDPKITDYQVYSPEGDNVTEETFSGKRLLIIIEKSGYARMKGMKRLIALINELPDDITPMILTASTPDDFENFRHEWQLAVPYYFVDSTVLKAMVRSNPGVILLKNGTVLGKWHANDIPDPGKL